MPLWPRDLRGREEEGRRRRRRRRRRGLLTFHDE
jgi:hypothetical protein